MIGPAAVIDTNVVVNGLLAARPDAPTAAILDGMIAARFPFLLSDELIAEYREVLLRPKIRRFHGLTSGELDRLLADVVSNGRVRQVDPVGRPGIKRDEHLWALLAAEPSAVLVTGDQPLIRHPRRGVRALSPRAFAELAGLL